MFFTIFCSYKSGTVVLSYEGKDMRNGEGKPFQSHINSIALTRDNEYFYFKPINQFVLYRIAAKELANASLTDEELLKKVENEGNTVITHGMETDTKGNIFLTSSILQSENEIAAFLLKKAHSRKN